MNRSLSVVEFGKRLLEMKDVDPVYVLLYQAKLPKDLLRRWLLAYWCFYHVGTASWISAGGPYGEGRDYWSRMVEAASSKVYPRCHERRHFRGAFACKVVAWLQAQGINFLFGSLAKGKAKDVMQQVQGWYGFGPWIAFKVADMLERLGLLQIQFSLADAFYKGSPTEGAELLWETTGKPNLNGSSVTSWAAGKILGALQSYKAPPRYDRPLGVQEAETILCKWKSYRGGHYHLGEDVESCQSALLRFARCKLSQRLYQSGRTKGLW